MVGQGEIFPPKGIVGYLVMLIAIGMSLMEIYLAVTGGMDAIFERPMFYMAAAAIIFLTPLFNKRPEACSLQNGARCLPPFSASLLQWFP